MKETSLEYSKFIPKCEKAKAPFIFQIKKPPTDEFRRAFVNSTVYVFSGHNSGLDFFKAYLKEHPPTRLPFIFLFGCKSLEFTVSSSNF